VCACVCSFLGSVQRSDLRRFALLRREIGSGERQASEFTSQNLRTARLDISMLSSRAVPSRSEDLQALGSSLSHLQLSTAGSSNGQPQATSGAPSLIARAGGWRRKSSFSDPLGVQADLARAAALAQAQSPVAGIGTDRTQNYEALTSRSLAASAQGDEKKNIQGKKSLSNIRRESVHAYEESQSLVARAVGEMRDKRDDRSAGNGPRVVLHF
jgi:hypothetical protein